MATAAAAAAAAAAKCFRSHWRFVYRFAHASRLVDARKYAALWDFDELRQEIIVGRCLLVASGGFLSSRCCRATASRSVSGGVVGSELSNSRKSENKKNREQREDALHILLLLKRERREGHGEWPFSFSLKTSGPYRPYIDLSSVTSVSFYTFP